jgi:uncharacterized membrane protein YuzA (DUF378 family)
MIDYQTILLISVIISAIGAINWLTTANGYNVVDSITGSDKSTSTIIYDIIGVAGIIVLYNQIKFYMNSNK